MSYCENHLLKPYETLPLEHIPLPDPSTSLATKAFNFIKHNTPNVKAFVIDLFYSYALQPASSLGIPVFYFFTSGQALKRSQKLTYLLKLEGFSL
ncbi:hypothetical protein RJT34_12541 [Clitoria ternatea]|uniref:Uncharacterized protein n=1 Tax=Clitoria ternatea TaxID=43366 RepID=A0AAN9PJE9_CLITE